MFMKQSELRDRVGYPNCSDELIGVRGAEVIVLVIVAKFTQSIYAGLRVRPRFYELTPGRLSSSIGGEQRRLSRIRRHFNFDKTTNVKGRMIVRVIIIY